MRVFDEVIDLISLFFICLTAGFLLFPPEQLVAPVLVAVTAGGFLRYVEKVIFHRLIIVVYSLACLVFPLLLIFAPLMVYESFRTGMRYLLLFLVPSLYSGFVFFGPPAFSFVVVLCFAALLWATRSTAFGEMKKKSFDLEDELSLLHERLQQRQQQLLEQQEVEINLATMNERTRIARDIHDNVGHLLSSALLQTAALRATCGANGAVPEDTATALDQLQGTLDRGMNSIRDSVHQLHEASLDLEQYLHKLLEDFSFCKTDCVVEIYSTPGKEVKYAVIAMVKEALSNVAKHSDADHFALRLKEHPGFYQLILEDDGGISHGSADLLMDRGIGLRNIRDRIESLQGQFRISTEGGFRLFLTIPKPKKD